MSQTAQPVDPFMPSTGEGNTFKVGFNENVRVQSYSIEQTDPTYNPSLKIVYVHVMPNVEEANWSTMMEFVKFPKWVANVENCQKNVRSLMSHIQSFLVVIATKEEIQAKLLEFKSGLPSGNIDITDQDSLNKSIQPLVTKMLAWAETKGLFTKLGNLVVGYQYPKEKNGKTTQYRTPASYGQSGCWKSCFRTAEDRELPAEKLTGFVATASATAEQVRGWNYWSYTPIDTNAPAPTDAAPEAPAPTTDVAW